MNNIDVSKNNASVGQELMSGVSAYGRVVAIGGLIVASIIAIVLFYFATKEWRDKHTRAATMSVTAVNSTAVASDSGSSYKKYNIDVTYVDSNGVTQSAKGIDVSSTPVISVGSTLQLRYDPASPSDVVQEGSPSRAAAILTTIAVVVLGIGIGNVILTRKSSSYAAMVGIGSLVSPAL